MARGRATFEVGGRQRTLDIPMLLAEAIEDATGQSVFELFRGLSDASIRYGHAAQVVRCTLEHHGIPTPIEKVHKWADDEGPTPIVLAAGQILAAFFERPAKAKGVETKGKPKPARAPAISR